MKKCFNKINRSLITLIIPFTLMLACKDDQPDPNKPPVGSESTLATISTIEVKEITDGRASVNVSITNNGGSEITESGVCWSRRNENPTIETDHKNANGKPNGEFSVDVDQLNPFDTYYVRAYATNAKGTAYGETKVFKTLWSIVKDIDQNIYHAITIGDQVWMMENLKTTKQNNGTALTSPPATNAEWLNLNTPAYCWYNNQPANGVVYGALYNWYAVNTQKLAPLGWHVPGIDEWNELIDYLGGNEVAGGKLKAAGNQYWNAPNVGATNESKFTALPGGYRSYVDGGEFVYLKSWTHFWTAEQVDDTRAHFFVLSTLNREIKSENYRMVVGKSVRCIRDTPANK